ncbi:MAG: hypothetical protein E7538_05445 [Ruminococcaceae bacterium]|nr:hypothetical protein [Oscillospiraceae bacterium]
MNANVSIATARNWERLHVDISKKLTKRANKQMSQKHFFPLEYIENRKNIQIITDIVNAIFNNGIDTYSALYTIAVKQLIQANIYQLPHVQKVLSEYEYKIDDFLYNIQIPTDERDLLGVVYQSLSLEGEKNQKGSYYTPKKVVQNMMSCVFLENEQKLLDPCCGSGSFLLSAQGNPSQIYGMDNDFLAVFICKINLLLKYSEEVFIPQIYCGDFLQDDIFNMNIPIFHEQFEYIITNPPWGAVCVNNSIFEITSKESFSCFYVKAFGLLKEKGCIRFLFPESILNVKAHRDIREFILSHGSLDSITLYTGMFSGVTTKYIDIEASKNNPTEKINIYSAESLFCIDRKNFYNTENRVFNFQDDTDSEIISQVKQKGAYTLKNSIWALGVVTGNNKEKLLIENSKTSEAIYTGKEILPYVLKKPVKHIEYNRNEFQQVAKEEIYRAEEKLVYKFISNKLVFAYDNNQSLFLNSANILIPKIPNMSIKTVMAFLNSELYQYLYLVLFSEIKILKGNLLELPFAKISSEKNEEISFYVDRIIAGDYSGHSNVQDIIYDIFEINKTQRKHIKEKLNGTFN